MSINARRLTVKGFKPKGDYFAIKQITEMHVWDEKRRRYFYKVIGLGSDDRCYLYTSEGWKELVS